MCDGISGQQTARWRCCCGHGKCGGVRSQCKSDYHLFFSLPEPRAFAIREAADAFKLHSSVQWPVVSQHSIRSPAKQTAPNGRGAGGKHTLPYKRNRARRLFPFSWIDTARQRDCTPRCCRQGGQVDRAHRVRRGRARIISTNEEENGGRRGSERKKTWVQGVMDERSVVHRTPRTL